MLCTEYQALFWKPYCMRVSLFYVWKHFVGWKVYVVCMGLLRVEVESIRVWLCFLDKSIRMLLWHRLRKCTYVYLCVPMCTIHVVYTGWPKEFSLRYHVGISNCDDLFTKHTQTFHGDSAVWIAYRSLFVKIFLLQPRLYVCD